MPTFDFGQFLRSALTQKSQPDPQVVANQSTYQDVLRKWYAGRPKFGTPDYKQQYNMWLSAKPTGKDIGVQPISLADALQGHTGGFNANQ